MKQFDLEAAKRGAPIVCHAPAGQAPSDVSFIGVRSNGDIVVEVPGVSLGVYSPHELRMKPQKRTVYLVAQRGGAGGPWYSNKDGADAQARVWNNRLTSDSRYEVIPVEIEL